jgi:hypothetical protein
LEFLLLLAFALMWSALGAASLRWIGVEDSIQLALQGPVTGIAIAVFAVSTANLWGASVSAAAMPIALVATILAIGLAWRQRLLTTQNSLWFIGSTGLVLGLTMLFSAQPLLEFGTRWQGLVNADAATNGLAAQYFLQQPFFGALDAEAVITGRDYSSNITSLSVASGHRFGDVMLLAMSAALTGLHPDQVYMAHALWLHVALVLVCASLVNFGPQRQENVIAALAVLSLSSLGAYNYLNQLIGQTGGLALAVLTVSLWVRLLELENDINALRRTVVALAITLAALLRYYPESVPFVGLAVLIALVQVPKRIDRSTVLRILGAGLLIGLLVLFLSNVSLPHAIAHVMSTLSIGVGVRSQEITGPMDYAFTLDVFPLVFGFVRFREVVADPWASAYIAGAAFLTVVTLAALWRYRGRYVALFAVTLSIHITFFYLWFKREEFGTFKAILFVQPFVCLTATIVLCSFLGGYRWLKLGLCASFIWLNLSALRTWSAMARADTHPITSLIKSGLLDSVEKVGGSAKTVVIDAQSYLFQQFLALRNKNVATVFETDPQTPVKYVSEKKLVGYHSNFHRTWHKSYLAFTEKVNSERDRAIKRVDFGCGPEPIRSATFETRIDERYDTVPKIYPGGILQPFNRARYRDTSLIFVEKQGENRLVAQRESSLGRWEYNRDTQETKRSVHFAEADPTALSATMAAVGRYVLLEVLGTNSPNEAIELRMGFSRTFLGADNASIPEIRIHGATTVSVAGRGSGAFDVVSRPVVPCVVAGRRFIMLDFGVEPTPLSKRAPLIYQSLGVAYAPDRRLIVGFLRDVSIVSSATEPISYKPRWMAGIDSKDIIGYEGVFEDGWMSADTRLVAKVRNKSSTLKLKIDIDPSLLPSSEKSIDLLVHTSNGEQVNRLTLNPGTNFVALRSSPSGLIDLRLKADRAVELPNGDGRRVVGYLGEVAWE